MKFSLKYILAAALIAITWHSAGQTPDSLALQSPPVTDTLPPQRFSTADNVVVDSLSLQAGTATDSLPADSAARPRRAFLSFPIKGTAQDSLVFDVKNNKVYIYNKGNVTYEEKVPLNLQGDEIRIDLDTKEIKARGVMADSTGQMTRPVFSQGAQSGEMDSLRFNLETKIGLTYNSAMKQGEGFMIAGKAKIHPDQTTDALLNKYTTCNHLDHPHFYLAMTKARMVPGKKAIFGLTYFVLEDVPIYFPFLPFGFFPLMSGPTSGFIMPSFGEQYSKGFFLRGGGYYFRLSDHVDAQLTGSIFTLGSWDARLASRYMKRYKYSGNLSFDYNMNVIGEKGSADYMRAPSYSLRWAHQQDPKLRPGTTFSASVNFTSSGHARNGAQTLNDRLQTQTSSSVAYGKNWGPGRGWFPGANLSTSLNISQYSRDSTVTISFPNASWGLSKFKPLRRREATGKERWYEKLSMSYKGGLKGDVTTKEKYLGKSEMLDNLKTGVTHSIPISTAWTVFGYINITPQATFNDNMYFKRVDKRWDAAEERVINDTTSGFWNTYDYNFSVSTGTKVYGMFLMKNTQGWLKAVRHVLTPSASFSYRPDFSTRYRKKVQSSANGQMTTYSPFDGQAYGVPGGAKSASLSFGLQQNLEAKIRDGDTVRVIKIIDNLSINSGYNFVAEEFNLSNFSVTFNTPIYKQYALRFSATLDPYALDEKGNRVNRILMKEGKMPRLTNFNTSFSWSLNQSLGSGQPINDTGIPPQMLSDAELEMLDPVSRLQAEEERRRLIGATYYDFSIPYNLSAGYTFSYSKPGRQRKITQTANFNGSLTLTPYQSDGNNRWGITFGGGYDIQMKKLWIGNINIIRDLHCFVMSLTWVPTGYSRSWMFNIRVKASVLQDLKYDKNRSMYDNSFD